MPLKPIALKETVSTEPIEAKSYDSMWIKTIQVRTPDPFMTSGDAYIEYVPMESGTGQTFDARPVQVNCSELWLAAATVPEVGKALECLLDAIRPLEDFILAREAVKEAARLLDIEARERQPN